MARSIDLSAAMRRDQSAMWPRRSPCAREWGCGVTRVCVQGLPTGGIWTALRQAVPPPHRIKLWPPGDELVSTLDQRDPADPSVAPPRAVAPLCPPRRERRRAPSQRLTAARWRERPSGSPLAEDARAERVTLGRAAHTGVGAQRPLGRADRDGAASRPRGRGSRGGAAGRHRRECGGSLRARGRESLAHLLTGEIHERCRGESEIQWR